MFRRSVEGGPEEKDEDAANIISESNWVVGVGVESNGGNGGGMKDNAVRLSVGGIERTRKRRNKYEVGSE